MSSIYNGVASNVSPPSALTITGVSPGSTPTVTVSAPLPASIVSQFMVTITGVQGAVGANGTWTATKTGASTFTVPSGAPGSYTSGGSAQPLLLEGITIPADGDLGSAASVNPAFESIQDQVDFLLLATGQLKLIQYFNFQTTFTMNAAVASCPNLPGGLTWFDLSGLLASFMPFAQTDAQTINVENGDIVRVTFSSSMLSSTVTNNFAMGIWYANWAPGAAQTFVQSGGGGCAQFTSSGARFAVPMTLTSYVVCTTTGLFDFKIRGIATVNPAGGDIALVGTWAAEAMVFRQNITIPQ